MIIIIMLIIIVIIIVIGVIAILIFIVILLVGIFGCWIWLKMRLSECCIDKNMKIILQILYMLLTLFVHGFHVFYAKNINCFKKTFGGGSFTLFL